MSNENQNSLALPANVGGVAVYVTVSEASRLPTASVNDTLRGGISNLDFDDVAKGVEGLCLSLGAVLKKVAPTKASIEFSVGITAKSGKLTALLLDGAAEGSIKVSLEWSADPASGTPAAAGE